MAVGKAGPVVGNEPKAVVIEGKTGVGKDPIMKNYAGYIEGIKPLTGVRHQTIGGIVARTLNDMVKYILGDHKRTPVVEGETGAGKDEIIDRINETLRGGRYLDSIKVIKESPFPTGTARPHGFEDTIRQVEGEVEKK